MKEDCSTCRFWFGGPQGDPNHGLCRKRPPVVTESSCGVWPETYGHDWCGKWWISDDEQNRRDAEYKALNEKHRACWTSHGCALGLQSECPTEVPF
jgi:hypothetical protein